MNFDMIEEKWTAFAGSAKDPLQVTNVRTGEGSFRSYLSEIGEELSFTKNEFNLYMKRWNRQVYYPEFKRMFGLIKRIKTEIRTSMETVKDMWSETSGKGLVPLYYDSDQEPSFHTFLKHMKHIKYTKLACLESNSCGVGTLQAQRQRQSGASQYGHYGS